MHEAQTVILRLLRLAPGPARHPNPASRRTRPHRPVLMPSSSPGNLPRLLAAVRGAKLVAVSTCHGRLVPAISIIGVCAFRYRTFAGLYSYNFVSQDSDVGQRHLSKTKYP